MNRCPISYQELQNSELEIGYSKRGLASLSPALKILHILEYDTEQLRQEGLRSAAKMSIQGIQPKVSAKLNVKESKIELVTIDGRFILKPQSPFYKQLPENEDLTMKMASYIGINTPAHGLVRSRDNCLNYFVKRFDRISQKTKLAVEDFAQLSNRRRHTKYDSSIEQVIQIVEKYCTFPLLEKQKLYTRLLFCFVTGNEDMHLKNFSLITHDNKIELAPAYDLLNTTIAMANAQEQSALPLRGKKKGLTKQIFEKYLGAERLALPPKVTAQEMEKIFSAKQAWLDLISISFLSAELKDKYIALLEARLKILS